MKAARGRRPQVVAKDGEPVAVIIDIDEYRALLEKLDDADDIACLKAIAGRKLRFRKLSDFVSEHEEGL